MTDEREQPGIDDNLRGRAEVVEQRNTLSAPEDIESLSPEEIRQRLHELRVHQIELEMQNVELRQAQAALSTSQARYFDLYDLAPMGYCTVSEKGLILEGNLKASELLGLARGTLVGQMFSQFILTQDQDIYYLFRRQLFESSAPQTCELWMVRWDGTTFWAHLSSTLAQDESGTPACRIMLNDLSEHNQKKKVQEEERIFLRTILQTTRDGFWVVNSQGKIIQVNEAYCRMSGYTHDEILRLDIAALEAVEEPAEIAAHTQRLIANGSEIFETRHRRKDGSLFEVEISVTYVKTGGGMFVCFCRDITDRKHAEEQLRTINLELEHRVEQRTHELQQSQMQYLHAEKLSAIGKLSASIAHEFNNPLQGILAVLKGLRRRAVLEDEDKELLDEAIEEGDRIKELIRSLQEFNRPSTGKKHLMDVHKALDAVLLLYKSDFNGKRISVVLNYAQHVPQVQAVSDQIKQVFLNMITNAADACNQRGGVITVKTWQENEDYVAIAIQDTGVGINRSDMELIFQPFYTTKPAIKGTGLGLSICYGIINHHHGKIRVVSQPGKGSTFTILLPIKGAEIDT